MAGPFTECRVFIAQIICYPFIARHIWHYSALYGIGVKFWTRLHYVLAEVALKFARIFIGSPAEWEASHVIKVGAAESGDFID